MCKGTKPKKWPIITATVISLLLGGGTGLSVNQPEYAEGVEPRELIRGELTKEHIDSTLVGVTENLRAGDKLENITVLNGKIILHYYQEYDEAPHAPACIKWENR